MYNPELGEVYKAEASEVVLTPVGYMCVISYRGNTYTIKSKSPTGPFLLTQTSEMRGYTFDQLNDEVQRVARKAFLEIPA